VNLRSAISFAAVGAALLLVPNLREQLDFPIYYLVFLYSLCFWITQATSWNILSGYSGYFSFGQAAFFGVGMYTTAILVARYEFNFFVTVPLAGIAAAVLALLIGFVAFRLRSLRGEVFTLLTLVVTFALAAFARISSFVDGGQGRAVQSPDYPSFLGSYTDMIYRLGVVMTITALVIGYAIQHSRFGRGLFAIRDDEDVAEALGAPTFRYKMLAFAISGSMAGVAGAVHSLQTSYVTIEETFTFLVPLFVILMCVLGGRGHWLGPVIGATVIVSLQDRLAGSEFSDSSQIILGSILTVTILFVPEGLFLRLASRRRLAVVTFAAVLAVTTLAGLLDGLLTRAIVSTIAVLPTLFVPERWLSGTLWFRPVAPTPAGRPPISSARKSAQEKVVAQ
jgi:branched-chain amino acid transport system permease protein